MNVVNQYGENWNGFAEVANAVNQYGENWNGFAEVVAFYHVTYRYFDRFPLQGVDRN